MFSKRTRASACSAWEARLEDYLEGRLAAPQASEVEAHVRACARCGAALNGAKSSVALLTAANAQPIRGSGALFVENVMASIRREKRSQERWKPLEIAGWEFFWVAAAATLILTAFMLRIQLAGPRLPAGSVVQQSQVQELINVPISQPAVQDDTLLVASSNDYGR